MVNLGVMPRVSSAVDSSRCCNLCLYAHPAHKHHPSRRTIKAAISRVAALLKRATTNLATATPFIVVHARLPVGQGAP